MSTLGLQPVITHPMHSKDASSYHHGDLKACLIALAQGRVREHGPDSFSLRDISREAGVSHAAAYRHFSTKEALLAVVACQGFEALTAACQQAVDQLPDDPLAQLAACGRAYVQFGSANTHLLMLMFSMVGPGKGAQSPDSQVGRTAAELFAVLTRVIVAGQARGQIVPDDPAVVAWSCWALVQGCATLVAAQTMPQEGTPSEALDARVRWAVQAMVRGVQV